MPVPLFIAVQSCAQSKYNLQYTDTYSSSVPNAKCDPFTELVLNHYPCTLLSTECPESVGEHSRGQQRALPARRDYLSNTYINYTCFFSGLSKGGPSPCVKTIYCLLTTGSTCSREQRTAPVHAELLVHPCSPGSEHRHIVKSCGFLFL